MPHARHLQAGWRGGADRGRRASRSPACTARRRRGARGASHATLRLLGPGSTRTQGGRSNALLKDLHFVGSFVLARAWEGTRCRAGGSPVAFGGCVSWFNIGPPWLALFCPLPHPLSPNSSMAPPSSPPPLTLLLCRCCSSPNIPAPSHSLPLSSSTSAPPPSSPAPPSASPDPPAPSPPGTDAPDPIRLPAEREG